MDKMQKGQRLIDKKYRESFKDSTCEASRDGVNLCGLPAVGAHCNDEEYSGIAQKVTDQLIFPLCHECHLDQHANPGSSWWLNNVLKPQMRRRYRNWKQEMRKK